MVEKVYATYNEVGRFYMPSPALMVISRSTRERLLSSINVQVHKLCQKSAPRILSDFKPNLMVAIGGGGFIPARILR